jgi:hypothetical protein
MHNRNTAAQEFGSHSPLLKSCLQLLVVISFLGALILGTWGFIQYDQHEGPVSFRNALYHTAQMFVMHSPHFTRPVPWTLELGRWLAATTILLTVIGVARRIFHEERTTLKLRRLRGHTLVCGLGRKGAAVVERLCQQRQTVVVIDKAPPPDLEALCRDRGALVLTADAARADTLLKAGVEHARALLALCPDDATNCEIAAQACQVRRKAKPAAGPLRCHVQLTDPDLRAALQKAFAVQPATNGVKVLFFDACDPEARELLIHELPLDHEGVSANETRQVHLVILGFGRMGRNLAVRAAQLGHFANATRLRISVVDRRAEANRAALLFRYPRMGEVCDLEFHQLEAVSPEARALLEGWCADATRITSLAVCFDHEERALEIAVQLLPLLMTSDVRLALRLAGQSGLAHLLEASAPPELARRIRPFGMEDRFCQLAGLGEEASEQFARDIHQAYVKMRTAGGASAHHDPALLAWDDLPEDFRESSRQQADHIFIKLRAVGCEAAPTGDTRPAVKFTPAEIELLAEMEHRRWVAERLLAGWVYGPKKDVERRENPNLVPWAQLTEEIKNYDRDTVGKMSDLLESVGRKVCRRVAAAS